MESQLWLQGLIILVLVLINGVLSASEIALISARRPHLIQKAEDDPDAAAALRLLKSPERLLATVQVGITVAGFFASAVGALSFTVVLAGLFEQIPVSAIQQASEPLAVVLVTLVISFISVVFGELVPKQVAIRYADTITLTVARPIELLARISTPVVTVLSASGRLVLHLIGLGKSINVERPAVTEADLRIMFDVASTQGDVNEREAQMLHRVLEFTDRLAREVMTPRPEIVWLDTSATLADFLEVFAESLHTRYPMAEADPDNVMGVLYTKDVMQAQAKGAITPDSPVAPLMRPAYFVPETKQVGEMFEEMRATGHQIAIIVDEYGGTAGLVTLKQLMEEILGRVGDEILGQQPEYRKLDEHTFSVDGSARIDELNEALSLDLPEGDYETLAGFILDQLGHIPRQGEKVIYNDLRLMVAEMNGVKIEKVEVVRV